MSSFKRNMLVKHAVHSGVSSAAAMLISQLPFKTNLKLRSSLGGMSMPLWAAFFGIGVINSVMSDVFHSVVKSEVNVENKFQDDISMVISVSYSALMYPALAYLASPALFREIGGFKLALVGGASELSSTFVQDLLLE